MNSLWTTSLPETDLGTSGVLDSFSGLNISPVATELSKVFIIEQLYSPKEAFFWLNIYLQTQEGELMPQRELFKYKWKHSSSKLMTKANEEQDFVQIREEGVKPSNIQ